MQVYEYSGKLEGIASPSIRQSLKGNLQEEQGLDVATPLQAHSGLPDPFVE